MRTAAALRQASDIGLDGIICDTERDYVTLTVSVYVCVCVCVCVCARVREQDKLLKVVEDEIFCVDTG